MLNKYNIYHSAEQPSKIADEINAKVTQVVVAGVAKDATKDLGITPTSIVSVLAIVTATGAPATKCLLAPTTDYTVSGSVLTCKTDQSANTLIVTAKV